MTVYCVFVNDNGGHFLEKIFTKASDAHSYVAAQPIKYRSMYSVETWETE